MPHTVLIVDDEDVVRTAWAKALRIAEFHVLCASTADEALKLCEEHPIDAVVLDFIMPSMDGVQLLVKIRRLLPFVRSLIVSGKLDLEVPSADLGAELKAGVEADRYLHKPLSNDELIEAIKNLLDSGDSSDWQKTAQQATHAKKVTAKKAANVSKSLKARKKT
jgi:two-component system response regulator YesN